MSGNRSGLSENGPLVAGCGWGRSDTQGFAIRFHWGRVLGKMGLVVYTLGGALCQRGEPVTQPALCWMVGCAFVPDTGDGESGYVERRLQHLQPV
jgi:hypothetical protein